MGYVRLPRKKEHGSTLTMKRNLYSPNHHTLHSMVNRLTLVQEGLDASRMWFV